MLNKNGEQNFEYDYIANLMHQWPAALCFLGAIVLLLVSLWIGSRKLRSASAPGRKSEKAQQVGAPNPATRRESELEGR